MVRAVRTQYPVGKRYGAGSADPAGFGTWFQLDVHWRTVHRWKLWPVENVGKLFQKLLLELLSSVGFSTSTLQNGQTQSAKKHATGSRHRGFGGRAVPHPGLVSKIQYWCRYASFAIGSCAVVWTYRHCDISFMLTMVTVYGTTSPTQAYARDHNYGTKIDVPARFHCEKVKLLGLLRPGGRSKQNMFWPTQNRCSPNQTRCSGESCSSSYQPNAPLDNRVIWLWSHWTTSKCCVNINRMTISVQYDAGRPYQHNSWLQF